MLESEDHLGFSLGFDNVASRAGGEGRFLLDGPGAGARAEADHRQQERFLVHRGRASDGRPAGTAAALCVVAGVRSHVTGDHVPPAGSVRTLRTFVRFLAGVGPLMRGQVIRAGEDLAADLAGVGFDAGMQTHMAGEHVRSGERSFTDIADVGLGDVG